MLSSPPASATKQEIMDRVRAMAPRFAERAAAAEKARRIPQESVRSMMEAGLVRILIPKEAGGYGLGFDTWFEVTRELSKADASHGWCAGLLIHHSHLLALFPETTLKTVWAGGLDVPIAVSLVPVVQATAVDGG
jgi:alkylation response protein AidB-like acyl-CoA dehydrogenase